MFANDERYQLRSSEAHYVHVKAGISLKLSCIPPVNIEGLPLGVQVESVWDHNYGRLGFELSVEPCRLCLILSSKF